MLRSQLDKFVSELILRVFFQKVHSEEISLTVKTFKVCNEQSLAKNRKSTDMPKSTKYQERKEGDGQTKTH